MKYGITLNPNNLQAHLDIEEDIATQKNGIFTVVIKLNRGNICDYVNYQNFTTRNTQFTATPVNRETRG